MFDVQIIVTNTFEFSQQYISHKSLSSSVCSLFNVFSLQAFYPANKDASVEYDDIVAARCMFTGEGRTSNTYIGWVLSLNPVPLMLHHFSDYMYLCKP